MYGYLTATGLEALVVIFFSSSPVRLPDSYTTDGLVVFVCSFLLVRLLDSYTIWRSGGNRLFFVTSIGSNNFAFFSPVRLLNWRPGSNRLFCFTCTFPRQLHNRWPGVEVVFVACCHRPPARSLHPRLLHPGHHHPWLLCHLRYWYFDRTSELYQGCWPRTQSEEGGTDRRKDQETKSKNIAEKVSRVGVGKDLSNQRFFFIFAHWKLSYITILFAYSQHTYVWIALTYIWQYNNISWL